MVTVRSITASDNPLTNPDWLLFDINLLRSQSQWLHIPSQQRRQLPFMDQRLLAGDFKRLGTPLTSLAEQTSQVPDCQWIFHAGHCGSTLLAQILGDNPQTNALREPQVLRTLADLKRQTDLRWHRINNDQWQQWFTTCITYLGRPAEPQQNQVVLKATSHCNNLIKSVLTLPGQQRLLLLSVKLPVYLATMLRSDQHMLDIDGLIQAHMQDLLERIPDLPIRIPDLDRPKKIAVTWLTHMLAFLDAAERFPSQILLMDFETWLDNPLEQTAEITNKLGSQPVTSSTLDQWLKRYSKAPEQPYSPQHRQRSLQQSRQQHAAQIKITHEWVQTLLHQCSRDYPALMEWL